MPALVLPYSRAQHVYADALAAELREEGPEGLGLDRAESICPACWLAFTDDGTLRFGTCPDCWAGLRS